MLDINMSDVISVLNQVKPHLIALAVCAVLALAVVILCGRVKERAAKFMIRAQSGIAFFAALVLIVNLICFGPMHALLSLATGEGSISDESVQDATLLCEQIAEEGIVLLKNEQSALPLSNGTALNVFGWASTNPVYGGTGSGALSDAYHTVTLLEGLQNAGFQINSEISDFYTAYCDTRPTVGMNAQDWTLPEPVVSAYPVDLISNAQAFSDTALIVIARSGGENADLPSDMTGIVNGDRAKMTYDDTLNQGNDWYEGDTYLNLTNREAELVELVCSKFDHVVVVYSGANTFELSWVDNYSQIQGAVYCPGTGQSDFNALGSVLSGKVNPSGKTTDTFVYDLTQTPTFHNFGEFQYENMGEYELDSERDGHNGQNPVMAKARAYVEHWPEAFKKNVGLLLFGDVGTGKSFLAGCIANALLDQDVPVLMTNFPIILARLSGMLGTDRVDFLASLGDYDLLIIDDLGVERSTEYALEQVFSIIDSRYRSGKPLIVTTNLKLDEMKYPSDLARARIYDRILERCAPALFVGKNFRGG